jgi:hypothetical protein
MPTPTGPDTLSRLMSGRIGTRALPALVALAALVLASPAAAAASTGVQPQTISLQPLNGETQLNYSRRANASATSDLPVSFTASGACTADDSYLLDVFPPGSGIGSGDYYIDGPVYWAQIHLVGLGNCTVTASQPGDATYAPAPDTSTTFRVIPPEFETFITRIPTRTRAPKNPPRLRPHRHHRWVFEFDSRPPAPSYSCSLDAAPFSPCSTPDVFRKLRPGIHSFRVQAMVHGVADPNSASIRFRVPGRLR